MENSRQDSNEKLNNTAPSRPAMGKYHRRYDAQPSMDEMMQLEKMRRRAFDEWRADKRRYDTQGKKPDVTEFIRESGIGEANISVLGGTLNPVRPIEMPVTEHEPQDSKSTVIRYISFTGIALILAFALSLFSFRMPYSPAFLKVDFSAFSELWAGVMIHPLVGVIVMLFRSLMDYLMNPASADVLISNMLTDTVFILLTCYLIKAIRESDFMKRNAETREIYNMPPIDYSVEFTLVSGLISSLVAAFCSVYAFRFVQIPLTQRFFAYRGFDEGAAIHGFAAALEKLQQSFPFVKTFVYSIGSVIDGAMVFHLPVAFVKYFLSTLLVALLYRVTERYILGKQDMIE